MRVGARPEGDHSPAPPWPVWGGLPRCWNELGETQRPWLGGFPKRVTGDLSANVGLSTVVMRPNVARRHVRPEPTDGAADLHRMIAAGTTRREKPHAHRRRDGVRHARAGRFGRNTETDSQGRAEVRQADRPRASARAIGRRSRPARAHGVPGGCVRDYRNRGADMPNVRDLQREVGHQAASPVRNFTTGMRVSAAKAFAASGFGLLTPRRILLICERDKTFTCAARSASFRPLRSIHSWSVMRRNVH